MEMRGPDWEGRSWLPYCWAISIFACSRLVVALGLVFSQKYLTSSIERWSAGPLWYHQLLQWDSEWYFKIVTDGYQYNGDPSCPAEHRFLPAVSDARARLGDDWWCLRLRMRCCWCRTSRDCSRSSCSSSWFARSLVINSLLPRSRCSAFFPLRSCCRPGIPSPLALLLIVSFFLALKRKYYFSAALLAGLAVATRSTGIVLLPVLLWEMWLNRNKKPFLPALLPCVVLATSGIWLFMIYLWSAFGNPFAFADGQTAFHEGTTLTTRLVAALKLEPFTRMMLNDWNPWGQASWFTLLFIVLIVLGWSRLRSSWTLFAVAVLLLPYLTLSGGPAGFVSMSRFNLVSFPLFVVLADLGLRAKWLLVGTIGLFGALVVYEHRLVCPENLDRLIAK